MSFGWRTDFDKAMAEAKAENKLVLLKFSGSDWCIPCIKMEKQIFTSDTFSSYAAAHLEMVNADFPRISKHMPDASVVKQNETLAAKYDKDGHFPYTLLLNVNGKVLKVWDGFSVDKPEEMIQQINDYIAR